MKVRRALLLGLMFALPAHAEVSLRDAESYFEAGQYYRAARAAFLSTGQADPRVQGSPGAADTKVVTGAAYSWITLSLARMGLYQTSSYFFIRTLQSGDKTAIRRVLPETENLLLKVGPDLIRKYLIQFTKYDDYDAKNRAAYLYSLAKEALLLGQFDKAVGYVSGIAPQSPLWPFALQLRGSAFAIQNKSQEALENFSLCVDRADQWTERGAKSAEQARVLDREVQDLKARCIAGQGRTLYQMERFDEAERMYDRIPKKSMVWPDILFEQAWNAFAKQEYNRTLGKLVSYKSPALQFVFNSEADVLAAQSYLMLCLYDDANAVIGEFNQKYSRLGEEVKSFVEANGSNLPVYFELGRDALKAPLYTQNMRYKMANRFVRSPYFQALVASQKELQAELGVIRQFEFNVGSGNPTKGFAGFLEQVLRWRLKSTQLLGGAFVKNSLMDYHSALVADFEKISFIKLELLRRQKEKLMYPNAKSADRERGNVEPSRKSYQYYWSFNGEFWNDELGDYIFGLESQCHKDDPAVSSQAPVRLKAGKG